MVDRRLTMASIARKNLFEDIPRFLVAQAGIMFAVSLVTIQTGILNGFTRSTVLLIDHAEADLWVASKDMVHFELTQPMPLDRVSQIAEIEGVEQAEPLLLQTGRWRSPEGKIAPVRIIAFNPDSNLFGLWDLVENSQSDLVSPLSIITDVANLNSLDINQVGEEATINAAPTRLVGLTQGTQSIATSSFLFMSLENAKAYATAGLTSRMRCSVQSGGEVSCTTEYERPAGTDPETAEQIAVTPQPLAPTDPITYILVKTRPGQDIRALQREIEGTIPDVQALTRRQMSKHTRDYWQLRTGIGFVLGLGATVGVVVGMVIVGQILYSSVSDHIREFGTLKAMGASDWVIYSVIIEQALWMAVLGYVPSMLVCVGLGAWTFATQGITILITPLMATGIFGITIVMCVGSAFFAIQKVTHVDPAIVFKA